MTVNLKRGFLEGAAVAAICTALVALLYWGLKAENPFTSFGFGNVGLVAFSTGLLGFLVGAFRLPSGGSKE